MPEFTVKVGMKRWEAILKARGEAGRKAFAQGLNRLGKQAMNAGVRGITKEFNIKKARVTGAVEITRKATLNFLSVDITAFEQGGGRPERRVPGLANFGAKQLKGSRVSVKVRKRGGRTVLRDTVMLKGAKGGRIGPTHEKLLVLEKQDIKTVPTKGRYKGRRHKRPGRAAPWRRVGQKLVRKLLFKLPGPSVRGMFVTVGKKFTRKYVRQNGWRIINNSMNRFMDKARRKRT